MRSLSISLICSFGLVVVGDAVNAQATNQGSAKTDDKLRSFIVEIESLQKDVDRAFQKSAVAFFKEFESAKTSEQIEAVRKRADQARQGISEPAIVKILDAVRSHASDQAAVAPLIWVISHGEGTVQCEEAAELLKKHHLTHKQTIEFVYRNRYGPMKWTEPILRAQLASPNLPAADRPRILLTLAMARQVEAKMPEILAQASDDQLARLNKRLGNDQIEGYRKLDVASVEADAIALFNELSRQHGSEVWKRGQTYGEFAKSSVYEIQHLTTGKFAPEIYGEDTTGVKFQLGDYRGKVVMLSFWATWCGPCMALVPHEREIVARFKDKPFALIGINADSDKKQLAESVAKAGITWRSFWCGLKGSDGEIPAAWNVTAWPTVYVLDHKGIIRGKDLVGKKLDALLDQLVREAQEKK